MERKLIPYSVHLPEPIYNKIKTAAGARKASSLVRDAIVLYLEDDKYAANYNKALRDAINIIKNDPNASSISVQGKTISETLCSQISNLLFVKEPTNAKKKT